MLSLAEVGILRAKDLTWQLRFMEGPDVKKKRPCSLTSVIEDTVGLCFCGPGVSCECSLPDRLWTVDAEAGQIGQVIHNLLLNAEQAMPGGGKICVRAENVMLGGREQPGIEGGAYVRISVEDQGRGLSAEDSRRIFEPFFSTKGEGRGLGLASCHTIVKRHQGHIRVDSGEGRGAVFHVYLPAVRQPSFSREEKPRRPDIERARVLLIDDDEMIRKATGEALHWMGYEVITARDGGEGIRCFQKARENRRPFKAVVLDLTLPGALGGRETMKQLMTIDPGTKVVLFSARSDDPVCQNYREFGFCGIVNKPFELDDLSEVLGNLIRETGADVALS